MEDWRFYLLEMPSQEWIDKDLPLIGATVVRTPNAPRAIAGSLPLGLESLYDENGQLRVVKWGCAIVAHQEGREPVFGIVDDVILGDGGSLQVQAGGFTMYPEEMPWLGPEFTGVKVDPLDMVRKIWDHLESFDDGYIGVTVDDTVSPVRIGEEIEEVSFETGTGELVEFEAGPFRLARWVTDNLGSVITKLQEETPFDYREHSYWDGEAIKHRLEIGYPTLGVRRHDLTFEVGYNVVAPPPMQGDDYASEVWMQGAGEGRNKLKTSSHLVSSTPTNRMRRVHVETDKTVKSQIQATRAARPILALLSGENSISTLEVIDHPLAPFYAYEEGDEIYVTGDAGWVELNHWVRITEISDECDTGRRTLKVETV